MTSTVLAVAKLQKKSMIAKDAVENTFVFTGLSTPPTSGELDALSTAIAEFYNGSHSHNRISLYMAASLSSATEVNEITYYLLDGHLDGTPHGGPIRLDLWTLSAPDNTSLPDEVAIVVSYHRAFGSDVEFGVGIRPKARDRGRIYTGPWANDAIALDATTDEVFVSSTVLTALEHAAQDLIANTAATPWVQWSRTKADVGPVVGGWVDNRFDSQRRRQQEATFRGLW